MNTGSNNNILVPIVQSEGAVGCSTLLPLVDVMSKNVTLFVCTAVPYQVLYRYITSSYMHTWVLSRLTVV